jgi:hypothetical protein
MIKSCKISFFAVLLFVLQITVAQELRISVIIDDSQYKLSDRSGLALLKTEIENFVNNKVWTQDAYEENERINCNLMINVQQESTLTSFVCNAQIQSSRPIHNSVYETGLLNFADRNFNFNYTPGMQLEYNDNAYNNELPTLLAFYSYIILGMDYDSFSPNGGSKYYILANQAMVNIPNVSPSHPGWGSSTEAKNIYNRYWLIENFLNPQYSAFHLGLYNYHRLGLDVAAQNVKETQSKIYQTLQDLDKIRQLNTTSVLLNSFMLAKRDELISVFKGADPQTKAKAVEVLKLLDPAYTSKYLEITK